MVAVARHAVIDLVGPGIRRLGQSRGIAAVLQAVFHLAGGADRGGHQLLRRAGIGELHRLGGGDAARRLFNGQSGSHRGDLGVARLHGEGSGDGIGARVDRGRLALGVLRRALPLVFILHGGHAGHRGGQLQLDAAAGIGLRLVIQDGLARGQLPQGNGDAGSDAGVRHLVRNGGEVQGAGKGLGRENVCAVARPADGHIVKGLAVRRADTHRSGQTQGVLGRAVVLVRNVGQGGQDGLHRPLGHRDLGRALHGQVIHLVVRGEAEGGGLDARGGPGLVPIEGEGALHRGRAADQAAVRQGRVIHIHRAVHRGPGRNGGGGFLHGEAHGRGGAGVIVGAFGDLGIEVIGARVQGSGGHILPLRAAGGRVGVGIVIGHAAVARVRRDRGRGQGASIGIALHLDGGLEVRPVHRHRDDVGLDGCLLPVRSAGGRDLAAVIIGPDVLPRGDGVFLGRAVLHQGGVPAVGVAAVPLIGQVMARHGGRGDGDGRSRRVAIGQGHVLPLGHRGDSGGDGGPVGVQGVVQGTGDGGGLVHLVAALLLGEPAREVIALPAGLGQFAVDIVIGDFFLRRGAGAARGVKGHLIGIGRPLGEQLNIAGDLAVKAEEVLARRLGVPAVQGVAGDQGGGGLHSLPPRRDVLAGGGVAPAVGVKAHGVGVQLPVGIQGVVIGDLHSGIFVDLRAAVLFCEPAQEGIALPLGRMGRIRNIIGKIEAALQHRLLTGGPFAGVQGDGVGIGSPGRGQGVILGLVHNCGLVHPLGVVGEPGAPAKEGVARVGGRGQLAVRFLILHELRFCVAGAAKGVKGHRDPLFRHPLGIQGHRRAVGDEHTKVVLGAIFPAAAVRRQVPAHKDIALRRGELVCVELAAVGLCGENAVIDAVNGLGVPSAQSARLHAAGAAVGVIAQIALLHRGAGVLQGHGAQPVGLGVPKDDVLGVVGGDVFGVVIGGIGRDVPVCRGHIVPGLAVFGHAGQVVPHTKNAHTDVRALLQHTLDADGGKAGGIGRYAVGIPAVPAGIIPQNSQVGLCVPFDDRLALKQDLVVACVVGEHAAAVPGDGAAVHPQGAWPVNAVLRAAADDAALIHFNGGEVRDAGGAVLHNSAVIHIAAAAVNAVGAVGDRAVERERRTVHTRLAAGDGGARVHGHIILDADAVVRAVPDHAAVHGKGAVAGHAVGAALNDATVHGKGGGLLVVPARARLHGVPVRGGKGAAVKDGAARDDIDKVHAARGSDLSAARAAAIADGQAAAVHLQHRADAPLGDGGRVQAQGVAVQAEVHVPGDLNGGAEGQVNTQVIAAAGKLRLNAGEVLPIGNDGVVLFMAAGSAAGRVGRNAVGALHQAQLAALHHDGIAGGARKIGGGQQPRRPVGAEGALAAFQHDGIGPVSRGGDAVGVNAAALDVNIRRFAVQRRCAGEGDAAALHGDGIGPAHGAAIQGKGAARQDKAVDRRAGAVVVIQGKVPHGHGAGNGAAVQAEVALIHRALLHLHIVQ